MSFDSRWPSFPRAIRSVLYLFMILTTATTLDATSGEQRPGGSAANATAACPAASSWFDVMMYDNLAVSELDCAALSENGITELTLNASVASALIAGSNSSSETGANETCRYRWLERSFQTVDHVTFVGKLYNNGSLWSLAACFARLNRVTVRQADIGPLTGSLVDDLGSSRLDEFDLSDNDITNVTPGSFDWRLRHLKVIDLSRNSLTVIENETFVDLFSLRLINLSYNSIERIERAAFFSTLSPIHLSTVFYSNESDVSTDLLTSPLTVDVPDRSETDTWSALETVDLRHNILGEIDELIFRGPLSGIRNLFLSHNRISSLPRYIIDQLHQLAFIDLSYNDLVWLDVGAFSSASLRHVDLSHNALRKLVSMTFLYLPSITEIDLSYNKINQIYKYAFYRLCKADDSLDPDTESRDSIRHVNISLRANRLESEVIFQMMTLFEQQQDAEGDSGTGCSLRTDLRDNRIQYLLDPGAAIHLNRQDSPMHNTAHQHHKAALSVDLEGNDIQCDCRLVANLATFDKVAVTGWPSLAANPVAWRNLNCSGPELFAGFTVAEFVAYSLCPTAVDSAATNGDYNNGEYKDGRVGHRHSSDGRADSADDRRRIRVTIGNHSVILSAIGQESSAAADEVPYDNVADTTSVSDDLWRHHVTTFSGSHAALIALLLCAAVLALLGGLLFKRGGSGGGGGGELSSLRRVSTGSRRRRGDVFIVYSVEDEAWVTGTLLDVIYTRHPRYGVLLQHHVDPACASWFSHRKRRRGVDGKWPHAQLVLNTCMDSCSVTLIVVSSNFFKTVWNIDDFRSLLLSKLQSRRHRFLLVCLNNDVSVDEMPAEQKEFFDNSTMYPRLEVHERHFAEHLIDSLPSSGRQRSDSVETEESVALISDDGHHERY